MTDTNILKGKRVLIVDDEPDVLETLAELLDICQVDTASNFDLAAKLIRKKRHDIAIFDLMGVNGFELLKIADQVGLPALVLTGHALNPESLSKSIRAGAHMYLPKEKMADILEYLAELAESAQPGKRRSGGWFFKLKPYFDRKFGSHWLDNDSEIFQDLKKQLRLSNDDIKRML